MKEKKQSHIGKSDNTETYFLNSLPDMLYTNQDYILAGDIYHSIFAIREYPVFTERQGILEELGRLENVNLRIFVNPINEIESQNILKNSQRKNNMMKQSSNIKSKLEGDMSENELSSMLKSMREKGENFVYVTVIIDIFSDSIKEMLALCDKVIFILNSNDITFSKLKFRQRDGYLSALYFGNNKFEYDYRRVLPCTSVSNLYPFSYFGKYDSSGFYIGTDEYGGDIIDDITLSSDDKTNSNVLVLGNSGMGKSYLLKLLACNLLESGKNILIFDPENEYEVLTNNLFGESISFEDDGLCFNPMEIKKDDDGNYDYKGHVTFLLNLFSISCNLSNDELSILESFIHETYSKCYSSKQKLIPNLKILYETIETGYKEYKDESNPMYTKSDLSKLCTSLYPICKGIYSKYFNGKSFDLNSHLIRFCLKGIFSLKGNIREGVLYNILNFAETVLLDKGNYVLIIDELYLFLENRISIESIRSCIKRVRKRNSLLILATQNISDLLLPEIKEYTKPLLAIPQRKFLFSPGNVDKEKYKELLDISNVEYSHISLAKRGRCIYKCGNETYVLDIHAPSYKEEIFS